MASIAAASGAATTKPENTARSPMLFSSRNVGRCVTCSAWNSAVVARARASISGDFAFFSSAVTSNPAALAATAAASSQRPTFRPSRSAAFAIANRTQSSATLKSFAASATKFGAKYCLISGSNQPEFSRNGERMMAPLRR